VSSEITPPGPTYTSETGHHPRPLNLETAAPHSSHPTGVTLLRLHCCHPSWCFTRCVSRCCTHRHPSPYSRPSHLSSAFSLSLVGIHHFFAPNTSLIIRSNPKTTMDLHPHCLSCSPESSSSHSIIKPAPSSGRTRRL
jgi:hypothetical protein